MNILEIIKHLFPSSTSEFNRLVDELIKIGSDPRHRGDTGGYLGSSSPRAVKIGERLYELGGHSMMLRAHAKVKKATRRHSRSGTGSLLGWYWPMARLNRRSGWLV